MNINKQIIIITIVRRPDSNRRPLAQWPDIATITQQMHASTSGIECLWPRASQHVETLGAFRFGHGRTPRKAEPLKWAVIIRIRWVLLSSPFRKVYMALKFRQIKRNKQIHKNVWIHEHEGETKPCTNHHSPACWLNDRRTRVPSSNYCTKRYGHNNL